MLVGMISLAEPNANPEPTRPAASPLAGFGPVMEPVAQHLVDQVREARARGACLRVRGGGSKDAIGQIARGEVLDTRALSGITAYEPSELVISALAGTPLRDIEELLASRGQALAFEPPRLGGPLAQTTLGGVVASGLSGPARASRGAARDHVLGVRMVNGRAQVLRFGGSVMKNVAGFDLSRLMTGSMGTLGLLLEVTVKVLPQAVASATLRFEMTQEQALAQVNLWAGQPLPLDASAWWDGLLVLRLRGAQAAVQSAEPFWLGLRDQQDEFFTRARAAVQAGAGQTHGATLWRISVPATAKPLALPGETLVEWFGAQRWLCTTAPAAAVHEAAAQAGGHALAWVTHTPQGVVLPEVLLKLHRQVQQAFDPDGVFDTGRLWPRAAPD
jgi:glycolate oxidase FAD binding subunit